MNFAFCFFFIILVLEPVEHNTAGPMIIVFALFVLSVSRKSYSDLACLCFDFDHAQYVVSKLDVKVS